ncbi:MAG: hypothetical protein R3B90_19675 [Planctomycetaceae bacterium]
MIPGEPFLDRPAGAGEVLDRAALLVRRCLPEFIRIAVFGYLPLAILLNLIPLPWKGAATDPEFPVPLDVARWAFIACLVSLADLLFVRVIARGCLFAFAGGLLRGVRVTRGEAIVQSARNMPSACVATMLTGGLLGCVSPLFMLLDHAEPEVIVVVMLIGGMCGVAGLALAVWGYLAVAAVHFESRGPFAAIGRSTRLANSDLGLTFSVIAMMLIVRVITLLLLMMIGSRFNDLWSGASSVAAAIGATVLLMFEAPVELLLYFALRSRREDYDLEVMAREVELLGIDEIEVSEPAGLKGLRLGGDRPGDGRSFSTRGARDA